jgi:hypothetical protein
VLDHRAVLAAERLDGGEEVLRVQQQLAPDAGRLLEHIERGRVDDLRDRGPASCLRPAHELGEVDVRRHGTLVELGLENRLARRGVREVDADVAVEAAGRMTAGSRCSISFDAAITSSSRSSRLPSSAVSSWLTVRRDS